MPEDQKPTDPLAAPTGSVSDTPRTDAHALNPINADACGVARVVDADFARQLERENDKLADMGIAMALRYGLLDYICETEEASQRENVPEDVDFLFLAKDHTTFWGQTYMQAAFKAMTYDQKRLNHSLNSQLSGSSESAPTKVRQ